LECATLSGGAFGEAIFLRELPANEMIDVRIVAPMRQRVGAKAGGGDFVIIEMSEDGAERECVRVAPINGEDLVELAGGAGIILGVDQVLRE
jgi:hypothetical protein